MDSSVLGVATAPSYSTTCAAGGAAGVPPAGSSTSVSGPTSPAPTAASSCPGSLRTSVRVASASTASRAGSGSPVCQAMRREIGSRWSVVIDEHVLRLCRGARQAEGRGGRVGPAEGRGREAQDLLELAAGAVGAGQAGGGGGV